MTDAEYKALYGDFDDAAFNGVKSAERKHKYGEVLTPRWVVEKMLDEVPEVAEIEKTVFEPACGEGAFITCVLRRKLARASSCAEKLRACQTCYGIDIQKDNVEICRDKLSQIACTAGVSREDAELIFRRNIVHGDMLFFPMIARFYDWKDGNWTTLEQMETENENT